MRLRCAGPRLSTATHYSNTLAIALRWNWATAQNNLGNVLQRAGNLTGDARLLRQAEAALRDASLERTRDRAPMDWSVTQNNLGNALQRLGELTGDAAVLRRAEAVFRDALFERPRERTPTGWSGSRTISATCCKASAS